MRVYPVGVCVVNGLTCIIVRVKKQTGLILFENDIKTVGFEPD